MNAFKSVLVSVTLAVGSSAAAAAWGESGAEGPGFISVVSSQLKWSDAPSVGPGAKIAVIEGDLKAAAPFTFRLKLPPNFKIAVHTHPLFERVTVISGTFYFATGDKFDSAKAKEYKPGDAVMIPPGMPMYAYTQKGEAIVQIHGTGPWGINFLNPEDAPGKKK